MTSIPAIVRDTATEELLELALVENVQRADLNAIEEAQAYRELIERFGLTHEEVAARVGKSRVAVQRPAAARPRARDTRRDHGWANLGGPRQGSGGDHRAGAPARRAWTRPRPPSLRPADRGARQAASRPAAIARARSALPRPPGSRGSAARPARHESRHPAIPARRAGRHRVLLGRGARPHLHDHLARDGGRPPAGRTGHAARPSLSEVRR